MEREAAVWFLGDGLKPDLVLIVSSSIRTLTAVDIRLSLRIPADSLEAREVIDGAKRLNSLG